ncbi:MAG: short-chain dehydrogenase [Panacagrimonas sp.]|jgi:NAD(P)-dependent dehydrogenase (short-subunit alcohol dehydrogenase family)|nr:SDR family oxidoreductase [Panacagrimonas sp.]MCC2659172.1 short-chain dehydrogenase [Panacagrimonas sp.]
MDAMISLAGKRILLTQAQDFMGPTLVPLLTKFGAAVVTDDRPLIDPDLPAQLVRDAGRVDVLIAHLGAPAPSTPAHEVGEDEWRLMFSAMVDPLPRLARAVLPQMIERRSGKILVMGSASALRGMKRASAYSAARGAQLAWAQAVGIEMAPHQVQVNAIAQNLVDNVTYFPPEVQANPRFKERIRWEMPLGRLVSAQEDSMFAAYLCSDAANCFVGQVFPVCGGWVPR